MRRLRILEAAVVEALQAAAWYEQERPGLGRDFHAALDIALDLLEDDIVPLVGMPGVAGAIGTKRLTLVKFPYDVVVRVFPDEIVVVAVAHQSRRPGYWIDR